MNPPDCVILLSSLFIYAVSCPRAPVMLLGNDGNIMMGFDPESEVPYFYNGSGRPDYGAVRAQHGDRGTYYNWLEGAAAQFEQLEINGMDDSVPQPQQPPPRRKDYAYTPDGRLQFRDARNEWYSALTGKELEGNLREQKYQFDLVARNFRARNRRKSISRCSM
jgi:hypothetical protein